MTNIALVVLDTLRKDRFDEYFEWLPGRRFENAYSTANWTVPAHASLFTGKYGTEVGLHAHSREMTCPEETVAYKLGEAGYDTYGYSSNHQLSERENWDDCFQEFHGPFDLWYPSDSNTLDWNQFVSQTDNEGVRRYAEGVWKCVAGDYDTVQSLKQGVHTQRGSLYRDAEIDDKGASTILEELSERDHDGDEFAFINLMEAHTPYAPPEEHRVVDEDVTVTVKHSLGLEEPPEGAVEAYDSCVEYLSSVYEEIFDVLEAEFDYVITVSDHGEMLGENGVWNHTSGLYPELTHVPLVVSGGGLSGTVTDPVSLVDVHQTIASMADIEVESRGQDLLGEVEPRTYLTEYRGLIPFAVSELEASSVDAETIEQYQSPLNGVVLEDGRYGYETFDGFVPADDSAEFREVIDSLQENLGKRDVRRSEGELTEETRERLKDLGYA